MSWCLHAMSWWTSWCLHVMSHTCTQEQPWWLTQRWHHDPLTLSTAEAEMQTWPCLCMVLREAVRCCEILYSVLCIVPCRLEAKTTKQQDSCEHKTSRCQDYMARDTCEHKTSRWQGFPEHCMCRCQDFDPCLPMWSWYMCVWGTLPSAAQQWCCSMAALWGLPGWRPPMCASGAATSKSECVEVEWATTIVGKLMVYFAGAWMDTKVTLWHWSAWHAIAIMSVKVMDKYV